MQNRSIVIEPGCSIVIQYGDKHSKDAGCEAALAPGIPCLDVSAQLFLLLLAGLLCAVLICSSVFWSVLLVLCQSALVCADLLCSALVPYLPGLQSARETVLSFWLKGKVHSQSQMGVVL